MLFSGDGEHSLWRNRHAELVSLGVVMYTVNRTEIIQVLHFQTSQIAVILVVFICLGYVRSEVGLSGPLCLVFTVLYIVPVQ